MAQPRNLRPRRKREFTPVQVGAIFDLDNVQVNNLFDELIEVGVARKLDRKRSISKGDLHFFELCLALMREDAGPRLRAKILQAAFRARTKGSVSVEGAALTCRVNLHRQATRQRLSAFEKAESKIVSRPLVMQGEPCIRGTRISAYWIADIVEAEGEDAAREAYPQLTADQIRAAHLYVMANPRRGRPREIQAPSALGRVSRRKRTRTVAAN